MDTQISGKNIPATMAGLMLCLFLSALDNSIVGTAMPKIITDLHGSRHYSLPFTSYLLFSTVVIPIAGKLSDLAQELGIAQDMLIIFVNSAKAGNKLIIPCFFNKISQPLSKFFRPFSCTGNV